MRILFLPHGRRETYFRDFLRHARQHAGWHIGVVGGYAGRGAYADIVAGPDAFFTMPDFREMTDVAGDRKDIGSLIGECERASRIPINRLILASERDIGRAFGLPSYHWPSRGLTERSLADNGYARRVVAEQFAFMHEVIKSFAPDLILTGNFASPHHCAAAMLAARAGIPVLCGRSSKILSDRTFWSPDIFMQNEAASARYAKLAVAGQEPSGEAGAIITGFRNRPKAVGYIAKYWKASDAETWLSRHRFFAGLLIARIAHVMRRRRGNVRPVLPAVAEYYRTRYLAWRQRHFYARPDESDLARRRYVYMPFHKEPELAINFQAAAFHNQYETAAQLSASLPYGVDLVVREHRLNHGRRPTGYYRNLTVLPNLILADPYDDQFKYIRNAEVIVTDNGSSGWEGLLLGRPVATLAKTFYDATGLVTKVDSMTDLPSVLLKVLDGAATPGADNEDRERRIGWLVDAERATTVAEDEDGHNESIRRIEAYVADRAVMRLAAQ